ncbi:MAG: DUF5685 family protein [Bacillota bacterium]|jgi:hypothetical protein
MFGYIKPEKEELKIREFSLFRAYYCGLCLELKKRYGQASRLLLNYDTAFLGLFLSSINNEEEKILPVRCPVHPVQKQPVIIDNFYLSFAADINILLAYHNLLDNWQDDRSYFSLAGTKLLSKTYQKAAALHPKIDRLISEQTGQLFLLERNKSKSIDAAADTFAKILEEIYLVKSTPSARMKAIKWLNYNLGKWIYLIDAFDDLGDDIIKGRYNPYLYAYEYQGEGYENFLQQIKPQAQFLIMYTLSQIGQAYELLNVTKNKGILENIIFLGMRKTTDNVLNQRSCQKREKRLLRNPWRSTSCIKGRNS